MTQHWNEGHEVEECFATLHLIGGEAVPLIGSVIIHRERPRPPFFLPYSETVEQPREARRFLHRLAFSLPIVWMGYDLGRPLPPAKPSTRSSFRVLGRTKRQWRRLRGQATGANHHG